MPMTTVLRVASSSNLKTSVTRQIGGEVLNALKVNNPNINIIERDLAKNPIPHLPPEVIEVFYQPGSPALALSDQLVDELLAADILLIETPMYNFSISSALKAWIDHVVRLGRTVARGAERLEGLLKGKRAILVIGRGGMYSQGPAKVMDYQETYLRAILGYIGITEVETIYIENVAQGGAVVTEALAVSKKKAQLIKE
jgi:FMN-dependent NADH-azoreductase